jgi:hypothetical protein
MTIDLSSYSKIGNALLVRLSVAQYRVNPGDTPSSEVLKFSDVLHPITISYNGTNETYTGTGQLLSVSPSRSELRNTASDVTITLSGIPDARIKEIMNSKIKGSRIEIYRVLFNTSTYQPISISGNPAGRFFGIVSNFSLEEDYDITNKTNSNSISLICSSWHESLKSKLPGRKTNPEDMKIFYPNDVSFDRVPNLIGANYSFGAPG